MAKSTGRGAGIQALAVLKHRLAEGFGFALLLACFLLFLSLFTYDPRDGSLNTAVDAMPHNFLGHDGAVLADLLWQSLGLACFLIPLLLLAWSFRLVLHRPLRSAWSRLALLPAVLTLGAVALSILDLGALAPPAASSEDRVRAVSAAARVRGQAPAGALLRNVFLVRTASPPAR